MTQGSKSYSGNVGATVGQDMTVSISTGWTNGDATITWKANNDPSKSGSTTVTLTTCEEEAAKTKLTLKLYAAYLGDCYTNSPTANQQYGIWFGGLGYGDDNSAWDDNAELTTSDITVHFNKFGEYSSFTLPKGQRGFVGADQICINNKICPPPILGAYITPTSDSQHRYTLELHIGYTVDNLPDYCERD